MGGTGEGKVCGSQRIRGAACRGEAGSAEAELREVVGRLGARDEDSVVNWQVLLPSYGAGSSPGRKCGPEKLVQGEVERFPRTRSLSG